MTDAPKDDPTPEPEDILSKRTKAVDMLYEAMIFWHGEGIKIINEIKRRLEENGNGKDAIALAKIWKGYDDRWIDIAAKLAPYQSPKLSSMELNNKTITRYVVEIPRKSESAKEWLKQAEIDVKLIPSLSQKPIIDLNGTDDTIDEAEYEEINVHEVH